LSATFLLITIICLFAFFPLLSPPFAAYDYDVSFTPHIYATAIFAFRYARCRTPPDAMRARARSALYVILDVDIPIITYMTYCLRFIIAADSCCHTLLILRA